jgi:hypothetical protein
MTAWLVLLSLPLGWAAKLRIKQEMWQGHFFRIYNLEDRIRLKWEILLFN